MYEINSYITMNVVACGLVLRIVAMFRVILRVILFYLLLSRAFRVHAVWRRNLGLFTYYICTYHNTYMCVAMGMGGGVLYVV